MPRNLWYNHALKKPYKTSNDVDCLYWVDCCKISTGKCNVCFCLYDVNSTHSELPKPHIPIRVLCRRNFLYFCKYWIDSLNVSNELVILRHRVQRCNTQNQNTVSSSLCARAKRYGMITVKQIRYLMIHKPRLAMTRSGYKQHQTISS